MSDIATNILNARQAAGLTQAELAQRSHTSQPAINRYEQGRVTPRPATIRRLLDACRTKIRPSEILKTNRKKILEFAQKLGAKKVMVFGSIARGEDTENSDIDLLMDIPPTYSLLAMSRFRRELSEMLGIQVDLGSVDDLKPRIRERVLAEARPL